MRVRVKSESRKVAAKAREGSIESMGHAAAAVRLTAKRSIRKRKKASAPGRPPHSRRGQLPRAIKYAVDEPKVSAVIGPAFRDVGRSGSAHEHGGKYRGRRYPARAFMGPALTKIAPRLPEKWRGSVKP